LSSGGNWGYTIRYGGKRGEGADKDQQTARRIGLAFF
jgi:hypothetical protein